MSFLNKPKQVLCFCTLICTKNMIEIALEILKVVLNGCLRRVESLKGDKRLLACASGCLLITGLV